MKAGTLRNRVAVQTLTQVADEYGGQTVTYTTAATVWAAIEPLQGRERLLAQQVDADVTTRIRMRYRSVSPKDRVLFGSRVFEVESVINPEELGEELVLMCRERVT